MTQGLRAIIFDCDGVLLESVDVKTEAYRLLFAAYPEHLDAILAYHLEQGGVSRFTKIRHIHEQILRRPLSEEGLLKLCDRFSALSLEAVLASPLVAGAREFLETYHRRLHLFVVSGTPQEELELVLREKRLQPFFRAVFGSPRTKAEIIRHILSTWALAAGETLFVGDASTDRDAAAACGLRFIARIRKDRPRPSWIQAEQEVENLVPLGPVVAGLMATSPGAVSDRGEAMRRLYIVAPEEAAIGHVLRAEGGRVAAWLYLGERVASVERCHRWFGTKGVRLDLGARLQEVAQARKPAYVDYIGRLSERFPDCSWWVGSVASKNPYVSKVFLRACHVLAAADLIRTVPLDQPVVLVVEASSVREVLADYLRRQGYAIVPALGPGAAASPSMLRLLMAGLGRRAWFVVHHCLRLALARLLGVRRPAAWAGTAPGPKRVLLHGWVDGRSFDRDGRYHSTTLGGLERHLEARGWTCCLFPMIPWDEPYLRTLRALIRSGTPFLLPHAWLTAGDVCHAALTDLGWSRWNEAWPDFCGLSIGSLIRAELQHDWSVARVPANLLLTRLVERWRREGVALDGFVYSYENHQWERAMGLGFCRAYPEARLIGYQDANVPDLCLNFFLADPEFEHPTYPDMVVTNGLYSFEVLRRAGYPKDRLRQGGALRFEPSVALAGRPGGLERFLTDAEALRRLVLVVTPCNCELASEMVWKVHRALAAEAGIKVVIKCHPALPFASLAGALGGLSLPAHFEVSERPFLDLLRESGVLLYMDSTTCIEALAHGVAVVHVGSDWSLDLDTIGLPCAERAKVRTPEELAAAVRALYAMDTARLAERRRRGRDLVPSFFNPVGDAAYAPVVEALGSPAIPSSR